MDLRAAQRTAPNASTFKHAVAATSMALQLLRRVLYTAKRSARILVVVLGWSATHSHAGYWYYNSTDPQFKFYETATQYCEAHLAAVNHPKAVSAGWVTTLLSIEILNPELVGICTFRQITPFTPNGHIYEWQIDIVHCKDPNASPWYEGLTSQNSRAYCRCNAGYGNGRVDRGHVLVCPADSSPEPPAGRMCKAGMATGNPILPATAEKYRLELDWQEPMALRGTLLWPRDLHRRAQR